MSTIAGSSANCAFADGTGSGAFFDQPLGIAYDSGNGNLYVTDQGNSVIRQVTIAGVVTTAAGNSTCCGFADGFSPTALFNDPAGIAYDVANGRAPIML